MRALSSRKYTHRAQHSPSFTQHSEMVTHRAVEANSSEPGVNIPPHNQISNETKSGNRRTSLKPLCMCLQSVSARRGGQAWLAHSCSWKGSEKLRRCYARRPQIIRCDCFEHLFVWNSHCFEYDEQSSFLQKFRMRRLFGFRTFNLVGAVELVAGERGCSDADHDSCEKVLLLQIEMRKGRRRICTEEPM